MKFLDRFLQWWRIVKVRPFIPPGSTVLDIGCGDGALFRICKTRIKKGIGIDPALTSCEKKDNYELIKGKFPEVVPKDELFDVITMLAVIEHIEESYHHSLALNCYRLLKPKGKIIITSPSAFVDHILAILKKLKLIEAISLDEHYGFDHKKIYFIFKDVGLSLLKSEKFQLGCNNLYIFKK